MRTVFADTGYWIALIAPSDTLHNQARATTAKLSNTKIVTSEMVLTELLNGFSKRRLNLKRSATKLALRSRAQPDIEVIPQTSSLFEKSLRLYQKRLDQAWSLTDCSSFIIMQERGITEALAHDKHFEQAGFIALLRQDG